MATEDEIRLAKLGYKQEFNRSLNGFHNFGITFNYMSVNFGNTILFGYGLATGGPVGIISMWIVASLFTYAIGASMAEICSTYPTAGGLYYWSAKLGGEKYGPVAAWYTGWFNTVGQWGSMATGAFSIGLFISILIRVGNPDVGDWASSLWFPCIVGTCSNILSAVVNAMGEKWLARVTEASVFLNLAGFLLLLIYPLAAAPTRQSASFVFTTYADYTGFDNKAYVFLIAMLLPANTFIGYDSSAHMAEETKGSFSAGPWGIVNGILLVSTLGWCLLVAWLFAIQDLEATITTPLGLAAAQLFLDTAGTTGCLIMLSYVTILGWTCMTAAMAANSRMVYSLSRDGVLPFSKWLYYTHPTSKMPLRTILMSVVMGFVFMTPAFGSTIALYTVSSINTVGNMVAYGLPIFMRVTIAKDTFKQSEFNLGKFSIPCGWIAVFFVCLCFVLFILPTAYPVTAANFNYALVAMAGTVIFVTIAWFVSARKWFKGPVANISQEEIDAMSGGEKIEEAPARTDSDLNLIENKV